MKLSVVILAAGKGTRMNSELPKVLHKIAGKPMVEHLINTAQAMNCKNIHVICGHKADLLKEALQDYQLNFVYQAEQLGTGHAMAMAAPFFKDDENILMLYGDAPLIEQTTLKQLINAKEENGIALLTAKMENPTGYGRILRQDGNIIGIVEEKDASDEQRKICEVNTGVMVASGKTFNKYLAMLDNNNAQGEYYMTDVIKFANDDNAKVTGVVVADFMETEGANNPLQLAQLERHFQYKQACKLAQNGLFISDLKRFDLRGNLQFGKDCFIDANVVFEGNVTLGNNVQIKAGTVIKNAIIGDNVIIEPYCVLEDCEVKQSANVGPFARLRPKAVLEEKAKVGNFVEIKKATVGKASKVNHLSYIGDTLIGENCNIGAGVITCNYDGVNKHQTIIGDDVFVGSDCQLVAPVSIANGATIGAGTTVTKDVKESYLVISRVAQKEISTWQRPVKKK